MRLSHNLASLNVYRSYVKNLKNQSTALGRISSGSKINKAGEDPNAIAQSERMRLQIRSLEMANRNVQDGISMLQTFEGGLSGITESLQRVRELLFQSGGTANKEDKQCIEIEMNQMIENIDKLANNTEFNNVKILEHKGEIKTQVGNNIGEKIKIPCFDCTSKGLNLKDDLGNYNINIENSENIGNSINIIDTAIDKVLSTRNKFGALENRFESNFNNLNEISDRVTSAESGIRDADIAEEMMEFAKNSLLVDAGNAMMVQTNKLPQDILRILENVR